MNACVHSGLIDPSKGIHAHLFGIGTWLSSVPNCSDNALIKSTVAC